jgi:hypothetical protein
VYATGGSIHSRYFMVTIAIFVCFVFQWIFGYVAFAQLRQASLASRFFKNSLE